MKKVAIIELANAIIGEIAMMVHIIDTSVAAAAVVDAGVPAGNLAMLAGDLDSIRLRFVPLFHLLGRLFRKYVPRVRVVHHF